MTFRCDRCDAWRELVPAANSGYATRQSARFFKHKQTLEFMERICFRHRTPDIFSMAHFILFVTALATAFLNLRFTII